MKILHITTHFNPFVGGLENLVFSLASEQAKTHDVSILTLQYDKTLPEYEEINGLKIFRHPCFSLLKNRYSIPHVSFCKSIAKTKPDVVFTHTRFFLTSFLGGRGVKKWCPQAKWVHVEHGQNFVRSASVCIVAGARVFDQIFGRWIFKNADSVVVLSEKGRVFAHSLGAQNGKIVIIPNGVKMPAKTTPPPRKNKALFFGRIIPEKGVSEILTAAKNCPCWKFEIVGENHRRFLAPRNVSFAPPVPHHKIQEKIQNADLVLLPSHSEGHSLAVLEAAAGGRPILATPVGQNETILSPEFIVPIRAVDPIKQKLDWLGNNWTALEAEGKKNKQRACSSFGFDHMVEQYEKLLY